jgi:flagellar hook assembly protein FlgD
LLPSLGETLDFSYSFPNKSRVIIRIYDLSGRFITSLVDKYYPNAGNVVREEDSSAWDGRDQLGQIVSPGTYIMHMEVMNPVTGVTQTDAAPIVVGVKN